MLNLQIPLPWDTWQELRTESKTRSESILSMMLEAKVGATHLQHFISLKVIHCKKDDNYIQSEYCHNLTHILNSKMHFFVIYLLKCD